LMRAARLLRAPSVLLSVGLAVCFLLSWLAGVVGLAPIVGAFAAGLIFEPAHYVAFTERGEQGLDDLVKPIGGLPVPVLFVLAGAPLIGPAIYSAVVVMIILTTLMTPPLLKWALERGSGPPAAIAADSRVGQ